VRIGSLQLLLQHLQHYVMPPVNQRSFIAVKEIFESVLLLPNVYLDFATLCRLAQR
jgi:hypothetical protein